MTVRPALPACVQARSAGNGCRHPTQLVMGRLKTLADVGKGFPGEGEGFPLRPVMAAWGQGEEKYRLWHSTTAKTTWRMGIQRACVVKQVAAAEEQNAHARRG